MALAKGVAPFDGVVVTRNFDPGAFIRSARDHAYLSPLLVIQRIDTIRIVLQIPSSDIADVRVGDLVDIKVGKVHLPGNKIARIAFSADRKTRTMRAEIDVPNPKGLLRPGTLGKALIHLRKGTIPQAKAPKTKPSWMGADLRTPRALPSNTALAARRRLQH